MWFGKKSARRKAIHEDITEAQRTLVEPLRPWLGQTVVIAAVFFLAACATLLFPGDPLALQVGDVALHDLTSPASFTYRSPAESARVREQARKNTPPLLVPNKHLFDRVEAQLMSLPPSVLAATTGPQLAELQARWPGLSPAALNELHRIGEDQQRTPGFGSPGHSYGAAVATLLRQLETVPVVDSATQLQLTDLRAENVSLAATSSASGSLLALPRNALVNLSARTRLEQVFRAAVRQSFPPSLEEPVVAYLLTLNEPTYRYDADASAKLAERNAQEAGDVGTRIVRGEVLVREGDVVTPDAYRRLIASRKAYQEQLSGIERWKPWLARGGLMVLVLALTVAGMTYAAVYLQGQQKSLRRAWGVVGLFLLTLILARLTLLPSLSHLVYLLGIAPTLLVAVVLVVAYNQRFALGMAGLHGVLVTLALGQGIDFLLTLAAGIVVLVSALRQIRTLGRLVETGMYAGIALFVAVWALGLAHNGNIHQLMQHSVFAALAGVIAGFVALGSLRFIESLFGVTTAVTLLEYCDTNQPLLRRLAAEAPGTFNHSLVVGILAEAAGEAIGINGLLCRVGAYYHDIGKLSKPQYFTENQGRGPNRHDKLSPAMSLLIIVGHVKDGIELAREYRLPSVLQPFIAQHHGTTVVEYFFNAARARQGREGNGKSEPPTISEGDFRYPGPKPRSKETAILMICDGAESIVRSMGEPTAGRIETAVHQLIMKRLMDDQFSECDLTLKELGAIEQSLVRTLAGVYHGRVSYAKPQATAQPA